MPFLLVFFIVVVVLELIGLAGIWFALVKIRQGRQGLADAKVRLSTLQETLSRSIRYGKITADSLEKGAAYMSRLLPWWMQLILKVLCRLGKIKPKTS